MSDTPAPGDPTSKVGTCPVCRRASDPVLRPFCSKHCADVDLHRWLSGSYRIPAEDEPEDLDETGLASEPRSE